MMRNIKTGIAWAAAMALVAALPTERASADHLENPYRQAKVGDWAQYKNETKGPTKVLDISFEETRTVTANDGKTVTIKRAVTYDGGRKAEFQTTIDVTRPIPLERLLGYEAENVGRLRIVKVREGQERLRLGERTVETHWTSYNIDPNGSYPAEKQVWIAEGVPFGGVVQLRTASHSSGLLSTEQMLAFGSADGAPDGPIRSAETAPIGKKSERNIAAGSRENSIGQRFLFIPSGSFQMGAIPRHEFMRKVSATESNETRLDLLLREPPQLATIIDQDFWMSAHEVTIGQFRQFLEATGFRTEGEKSGRGGTGLLPNGAWRQDPRFSWQNYGFPVTDEHPVANVTWNDATAFCKWLNEKEGRTYRLPTEAEWEYACRGRTETTYFTGDDLVSLEGFANMADQSLLKKTPGMSHALGHDDGYPYLAPVGRFKPNAFGLHDMHGNVLEWCKDRFAPFDPLKDLVPQDPPREVLFVLRGGNWFNDPRLAGSACRTGAPPDKCMSLIGFRIVMEDSK